MSKVKDSFADWWLILVDLIVVCVNCTLILYCTSSTYEGGLMRSAGWLMGGSSFRESQLCDCQAQLHCGCPKSRWLISFFISTPMQIMLWMELPQCDEKIDFRVKRFISHSNSLTHVLIDWQTNRQGCSQIQVKWLTVAIVMLISVWLTVGFVFFCRMDGWIEGRMQH